MRRRARTIVLWAGAAVALLAAATIVIHIPAVQQRVGGCPFGHDRVRTAAATAARTGPLAPARPALGFTLAATTRAEILAWARAHAIACESRHGARALECRDVPADLLADHGARLPGTTTWFELDERGTVAAIKTVRRTTEPRIVATAFAATDSALRARMGTPTSVRGSAHAGDLARGAFRQAMVEYAYADYRAQIRATNMGNGYLLTESYTAL